MNDELEQMIRTFRPKMGEDRSIRIAKMVEQYRAAQRALAAKEARTKSLARAVKRSTQAERDMERIEERIEKLLLDALSTYPQV